MGLELRTTGVWCSSQVDFGRTDQKSKFVLDLALDILEGEDNNRLLVDDRAETSLALDDHIRGIRLATGSRDEDDWGGRVQKRKCSVLLLVNPRRSSYGALTTSFMVVWRAQGGLGRGTQNSHGVVLLTCPQCRWRPTADFYSS